MPVRPADAFAFDLTLQETNIFAFQDDPPERARSTFQGFFENEIVLRSTETIDAQIERVSGAPSLGREPVEEPGNDLVMHPTGADKKDVDLFTTALEFLQLGTDARDSWPRHHASQKCSGNPE